MDEKIWKRLEATGEFVISQPRTGMIHVVKWDEQVTECLRKALSAEATIHVRDDSDVTFVFGIFKDQKMLAQFGRIPLVRAGGDTVNMTMKRVLGRSNWITTMRDLGLV